MKPDNAQNPIQRTILMTASALALLLMPGQNVLACGGRPPPPSCGKTLAVTLGVPDTLLLPNGGGTFDVSTLVYFNLVENPPDSGICPTDPAIADISVTVSCEGSADEVSQLTGVALTPGEYTPVTVPTAVSDGPPRQCDLWAEATVSLADGMSLTNDSHSMACIGEPSPVDTDLPRLDFTLIGEPGDERARVHPGSQAGYWYRLTNNDDDQAFSGTIMVESQNASRMPDSSGPMPVGTGPFPVSDPGQGDNFPVTFPDGLDETGCVPLPADPVNQVDSSDSMSVDNLAPGESVDLHFFTRPWGMCPNGACGNIKIATEGEFDPFDGSDPGFACAGVVVAADTAAPPHFFWPDSGRTVKIKPVDPEFPVVVLEGETAPRDQATIPIELVQLELRSVDPVEPIEFEAQPHTQPFSNQRDEHVRMQLQLFDPEGFPLFPSDLTIGGTAVFRTTSEIPTEIVSLQLTGGPTGSTDTSPAAELRIDILPEELGVDSFFDVFYQLNLVGFDELEQPRPIQMDATDVSIIDAHQFSVDFTGQAAPGDGEEIQALRWANDFRAFAGSREVVFSDGAESGMNFGRP